LVTRYWYRFLAFLGYKVGHTYAIRQQSPVFDAADATWSPPIFFQRSLNAALAQTIDWTTDTIKVRLVNSIYPYVPELWSNWRWED
jgi:hypothetical protein